MRLLFLLAACNGEAKDSEQTESVELDAGSTELTLPDLEGVDLEASFTEALAIALSVQTGVAWDGLGEALDAGHEGCPDLYAGQPEGADLDLADDDEVSGQSWVDDCVTPGGLAYRGWSWWDVEMSGSGDPETAEGHTVDATRMLESDGVMADNTDVRLLLKGTAEESLSVVTALDYTRWTWSSSLDASVTGTDAFGSDSVTPGGWRTDLYIQASGGDADTLELRGNVFFPDHRIAERFDSTAMELSLAGETGAAPGTCTAEPKGWMGIRDENAWWVDVVFLPLGDTEVADDDPTCDGCGTVYIRGLEDETLGEICLDFDTIWATISPPDSADFALSLRDEGFE